MADTELRNPIAELYQPDSGVLVTPDEALGETHFYCPYPNCLDDQRRLFRKKIDRYFFSHHADCEHAGVPETMLHKLAIRHFKELAEFRFPDLNGVPHVVTLDPKETILEYNGLKNMKPDVRIVSTDGVEYLIEVFVTHETKGKKVEIIKGYQKPTIEIDLNNFYLSNLESCKNDLPFVRSRIPELLSNEGLKKWLYHPDIIVQEVEVQTVPNESPQPAVPLPNTGDKTPWGWIIGLAVILIPPLRRTAWGAIKSILRGGRRS